MDKNKMDYASGRWKWFKPKLVEKEIKLPPAKIIQDIKLLDLDRMLKQNRIKLEIKKIKI